MCKDHGIFRSLLNRIRAQLPSWICVVQIITNRNALIEDVVANLIISSGIDHPLSFLFPIIHVFVIFIYLNRRYLS